MRAVMCREWGEPESLVVEEIEPGPVGPGDIRIRVHATALNFADTLIITGKYQFKPDRPFSPGFEVAGEVVECGPGVERPRIGDRVMATMDWGGYAEDVVVPAITAYVIPPGMDYVTAASFPVAYGTSHVGLAFRGGLKAGETLLVHGAAGGVGLTAVEIGKAMGATVIATAGGAKKVAVAREHGADHLIDYRSEDVRERVLALTDGRGVDVVYDPVGGDVFDASLRCTAWGGRILVVGFAAGRIPQIPANILLVKNIAAIGVFWSSHRRRTPELLQESYAELFRWYEEGRLRPLVGKVLPLERAAEAMRALLSRDMAGKIVLTTGV